MPKEVNILVEVASQHDEEETKDWLKLEQVEEKELAGNFVEYMQSKGISFPNSFAHGMQLIADYRSLCDGEGNYTAEVMIKTSRDDLEYEVYSDVGELTPVRIHEETLAKTFNIEKAEEYTPDMPIHEVESVEWLICFVDGRKTENPPDIKIESGKLKWGVEATGSIRCKYISRTSRVEITIPPAEDTEDGKDSYSANVFAIWAEGVESVSVSPASLEGECKGGMKYIVERDPDDEKTGNCLDRYYDACSGDLKREEVTPC